MLARLAVRPFGTIWKLKELCIQSKSGLLNKLYRFVYGWYQFEHGSKIDFRVQIDGEPVVPFGVRQIVINPDVKIGKNCVLNPQVMILDDHTSNGRDSASPIIGDNCYLGAGVKILGAVKIGNNVRIMANCVITSDIPDNSIVELPTPNITTLDQKLDTKHYENRNGEWYYFEGSKLVRV